MERTTKLKRKFNMRHILLFFLSTVMIMEMLASTSVYAAPDYSVKPTGFVTFAKLPIVNLNDSKGYYKMSLTSNGTNGTNGKGNGFTYDGMHYAQGARIMYQKKFKAGIGTEIAITNPVANVSDTGNTAGRELMYNIMEWNSSGTMVWDSGWITMDGIYTLGRDTRGTGNASAARTGLAYFTIIFKWADGNSSAGTGLDDTMTISTVAEYFPHLYVCYQFSNATISPNGGTYNGSTSSSTLKLGYGSEINLATPVRAHYTFKGWKPSEQTILEYPNGMTPATITNNATITGTKTAYSDYTKYKFTSSASFTSDNWLITSYDSYPILPNEKIKISGSMRMNSYPKSPEMRFMMYHGRYSNDWASATYFTTSSTWLDFSRIREFSESTNKAVFQIVTTTLKGYTGLTTDYDVKNVVISRSTETLIQSKLFMWKGNLSLTAQWEPNVYTVTLNNAGAATAGTSAYYQKYNTGNYTSAACTEEISSITVPKKTGYTFNGYYTGQNGTGTKYVDGSGSILSEYTSFTGNTTLYAYWTINNYTLSYEPNEGNGDAITESHTYGTTYTVKGANTFTKTGYTFTDWNDKADGSGTSYTAGSSKTWTEEKDISLYAQWEPNVYTVTLDNQSATTSGTSSFYIKYDTGVYSTPNCSMTISSIRTPAKAGYTFGGYFTQKNGGGEQYVDSSGSIVCTNTTFLQNTMLYAYWTVNSCNILYDANGGTGSMVSTSATFGTAVTLRANTFTRTGYIFKGWSTTANGSVEYNDKHTINNFSVTDSNLKLYAVWETGVYTITLDHENAETVGTTGFYAKYNEGTYTTSECTQIISSITIPEKTGYTFSGYYTGQNGTGTCYINAFGTITAGKTSFIEDTTLYANWTVNTYTIKYDGNGGTGTMENTAAIYGTSFDLTENAYTRTGYRFMGWSTTENGSVTYRDQEMVLNLTAKADKTITLYAVWEVNIYTITLDNQNAETAGTTVYYQKYETGIYSDAACKNTISNITIPSKTGYTFRGYYTSKDGTGTCYINELGTIIAENTGVTVNSTLYAHWTVNTYTIKYHANGGVGSMADTSTTYGVSVNLRENGFTNTGHMFIGWATSPDESAIYTDQELVTDLTKENGGIVNLYAVWGTNSYKVTYDANGGSVSISSKTYNYGAAVDLSITAEKPGHKFVGWSPIKSVRLPLMTYSMPNKNVTLYAVYTIAVSDVRNHEYPSYSKIEDRTNDEVFLLVWMKGNSSIFKTYPLTYKEDTHPMVYRYELPQTDIDSFANGREFYYQLIAYDNAGNYAVLYEGASTGEEIPDSEDIPKPPVEYMQTVKHYKYKAATDMWEWFDTTTEKVKEGITYHPSYITPPTGYCESHKDSGSIVTDKKTYNAYYKPNQYTLTFDVNGGVCDIDSKLVTYGGYYGTLPIPTKSGYTFTEWNTKETGNGEKISRGKIYEIISDSMVYAQWKPNVYTIILNDNGAEIAGTKVYYEKYNTGNYTTADCISAISTITKPEKTGYTFKGYYTEVDGKGSCCINEEGLIISANNAFIEDTTLYAYWVSNTYAITFHANGGSGEMEPLKVFYGEMEKLPPNEFTRRGYKFKGWGTSESGSVVYEDRQEVTNLTSVNNSQVSLYALWEPIIYEIRLDSEHAEVTGTTAYYQKYEKGNYTTKTCTRLISTITKPTKTGYTFKGYYTGKKGVGTRYIDDTGKILSVSITFTADTTLYAYWEPNTYTIQYHANGGSGVMADTSAKYNEVVTLSSNTFIKTGYVYKGWTTSASGNVIYTDKAAVQNLTEQNGKIIDLYAVWEPVVYTIKLDCDDGETAGTTAYYEKYNTDNYTSKECTTTITAITKPTRTGYMYSGYYTGKDGTGTQYIDAVGKILSSSTTFIDDCTLYAKWIPNTYTIQYHATGGSGKMEDTYATYGEYITLRTNTFTRTGYEFTGWTTSEKGTVLYENCGMVKNVTSVKDGIVRLYAVWKPIVYKISFDAQGATTTGTDAYYEKYNTGMYTTVECENAINKIMLPEMPGYIFNGYYTGKNGTGTEYVDASGMILATSKTFTEHTTLYADWKPITYAIAYNSNGGNGVMEDTVATYDQPVTLETNRFYKMGHTFKGWSTTANGTVEYQDRTEVKNLTATNGNSVTLYAVWDVNPYTVTYDYTTNGGNYVSVGSLSFDYGTAIDFTVTAQKDDYVFVGWNTDSTATTALSSLTMGTEPVTLYAIYKKDIKVTFVEYGNLGEITTSAIKTVYNNVAHADFLIKETTTWDGWQNIGWTRETDAMADSSISSGAIYTTDGNVTLYARYCSEVELAYDTNGSTMELDAQRKECYYNASGSASYPSYVIANAPVLSQHSFVKWKVESGNPFDLNGNPITEVAPEAGILVKENTLLKAIWDRHPIIEAFNLHFTLKEANAGIITEQELLRKVTARDEEARNPSNPEGLLRNGTDVTVKNYDASDFTGITGNQQRNVTYQAVDSFGNVATKTVTITITDTTMQKSKRKVYVRFISSNFFIDDAGNYISTEKGGLEENSIWRTNSAYNELLRETLFNIKKNVEKRRISVFGQSWELEVPGSGDWMKKEDTWIFTRENILEMKQFTTIYGHVKNTIDEFWNFVQGCKQS